MISSVDVLIHAVASMTKYMPVPPKHPSPPWTSPLNSSSLHDMCAECPRGAPRHTPHTLLAFPLLWLPPALACLSQSLPSPPKRLHHHLPTGFFKGSSPPGGAAPPAPPSLTGLPPLFPCQLTWHFLQEALPNPDCQPCCCVVLVPLGLFVSVRHGEPGACSGAWLS